MAGPAVVLGVAVGAGLIVRDCSLTCNVGFQNAPFAFLAVALLAFPFVALQLRWLLRTDFAGWQVKCALLAAVCFVGFRAWTYDVIKTVLGGLGFSVGMGLAAVLLIGLTFGLGIERTALNVVFLIALLAWVAVTVLQSREPPADAPDAPRPAP